MEQLIQKLKEQNLIDSNGNIILTKNEQCTQSVDVQTFNTFFSDKPFDYESMIGDHAFEWNGETYTRTAEQLGYKGYFDKWHELGVI